MKIAVLSDVHGNYEGLQAVVADLEAWGADMVIVNGDTVNRGPRNLACLQFVLQKRQEANWVLLRGNHEEYVLKSADPATAQSGPDFELRRFSEWTYQQLNGQVFELASMPDRFGWTAPDGSSFLVMHASVLGNRAGIYPKTTDEELRTKIAPGPSVFVTSHTHRALVREVDQSLVANIGAAGLPFDGNWRLSYGRFTWTEQRGWVAKIRRLAYDRAQAEKDLFDTGFMAEAGPFAKLILAELRLAQSMIHPWAQVYQEPFFAGEISLTESVEQFLAEVE